MNPDPAYILVVDDNADNRDMLSRRLIRRGYAVAVAEDGLAALKLIENEKFDLVLLDIMMPRMSGLEVLSTIRRTYSVADLPVIMATAKDQSDDIVSALKLGANDYVTKPLDFPVVLARVQTQLALHRLSQLKDEFLRIASHDLKNPLTVILGCVSLLERKAPVGSPMSDDAFALLDRITRRATEIQRIIEDFLDFQALQDGQIGLVKSSVNLNDLARDAWESNLEYAAGKGIALRLELDGELPAVEGDAARLSQVVRNFISNAVKFGPRGSSALIRTRRESRSILFEVEDTGPGLSDDDLKKVFGKYTRLSTKPTGGEKSSGLGLSICKQMIDLHGGDIGARNNPDRGATFWFRLPVEQPAAAAKDAASATTTARNVLLADDDRDMRFLTAMALEEAGYSVHAVENGKAAVDAAHQHVFDLILLDADMPVMNGYEAFATLVADSSTARTPIIFLTAKAPDDEFIRSSVCPVLYILKPYSADTLAARIEELLQERV